MKLAQVSEGVIVNIAVADSGNIPEHMSDWVEVKHLAIGDTYSADEDARLQGFEDAFQARSERDKILNDVVDPIVTNPLRWAELTADKQAEWTQYRIDLLNVPDQAGFPADITWPTKPE
jgi:hypothetical protein